MFPDSGESEGGSAPAEEKSIWKRGRLDGHGEKMNNTAREGQCGKQARGKGVEGYSHGLGDDDEGGDSDDESDEDSDDSLGGRRIATRAQRQTLIIGEIKLLSLMVWLIGMPGKRIGIFQIALIPQVVTRRWHLVHGRRNPQQNLNRLRQKSKGITRLQPNERWN